MKMKKQTKRQIDKKTNKTLEWREQVQLSERCLYIQKESYTALSEVSHHFRLLLLTSLSLLRAILVFFALVFLFDAVLLFILVVLFVFNRVVDVVEEVLQRIGPNVVLERFSDFADSIFGGLVEPGEESGRGRGDIVFASFSARLQIRFRD